MSILVNTHNDVEERLLIAFLNSHRLDYKSGIAGKDDIEAFIDQYNQELAEAESEIDSGDYLSQEEVENLFATRRKKLE